MKKKIIFVLIVIALVLGAALVLFLDTEDKDLENCKNDNIAEWVYAQGDMFETCFLNNDTLIFTDNEKALRDLNESYKEDLDKLASLYLDSKTKPNKKNLDKYNEACEKNTDTSLTEFCDFFSSFYDVYTSR